MNDITAELELIPRSAGGSQYFVAAGALCAVLGGVFWFAFAPETNVDLMMADQPRIVTEAAMREARAIEEITKRAPEAPMLVQTTTREPAQEVAAAVAASRGTLQIESDLEVLVYANGERIGKTPLDKKLESGTYTLRFVDRGRFLDHKEKVTVRANTTTVHEAYFGMGSLKVAASDGTKLWIDGRYVGEAPFAKITIAEGSHTLKLTSGDATVSEKLEVPAGQNVDYRLDLE